MAPIGMLHSAIAAENETHPNERLTALTDRLNNEAHRLQPMKDALRAKLIEVWHCTSFHQQHPDEAELGRLAGQLSFCTNGRETCSLTDVLLTLGAFGSSRTPSPNGSRSTLALQPRRPE